MSWRVLMNLVVIFIVLALLNIDGSRFETIVIAALVLIYANVIGSFAILGRATLEVEAANLNRFVAVLRCLDREQAEDYAEAVAETKKRLDGGVWNYWINGIGNFIVVVLALVSIAAELV